MKLYRPSYSQAQERELPELIDEHEHYVVVARWLTSCTKCGQGVQAYPGDDRQDLTIMDEEGVRLTNALVRFFEVSGQSFQCGKDVDADISITLGLQPPHAGTDLELVGIDDHLDKARVCLACHK